MEQPVYYFPCNRQIEFDASLVSKMMSNFRECLRDGGCIVTAPEHRLSLLLKLEICIGGGSNTSVPETASVLLALLDLHRTHLVNIVDESDEILRHKYQLLYTMGGQQDVDSGERRWKVIQSVLNRIPTIYKNSSNNSNSWPAIHLTDERDNQRLNQLLIDDILAGRARELSYLSRIGSQLSQSVRRIFFDHPDVSDDWDVIKPYLTELQFKDLLILRGLFCYQILHHSLKKRWSVDYGVDVDTKRRLMAVPFRGKDTPMPRTKFGHPDVALVLTHISYYHTGLSEQQTKQTLIKLKALPQRDVEYSEWLKEGLEDGTITTDASAINLEDDDQVKVLCRAFSFNRATIHFWLNCCVFPEETKQFPAKLMASAWDLAEPQSSTDDEISAEQVIDHMVASGSNGNVLIDIGALMIGRTNRQVADYWLSKAPREYEAAAYFQGDRVMVVLRDGHQTPLNYSPLKQCLARVLIYMDDIHTRGTDFRFPIPAGAFVTLGPNLPKDKLVQACMRMRQLAHGHSITFLAPREVYSPVGESVPTTAARQPPRHSMGSG